MIIYSYPLAMRVILSLSLSLQNEWKNDQPNEVIR